MGSLRLVMLEECNRTCEGCCNNDWDLEGLQVVDSFSGYDEILITGGEPMLYPEKVIDLCNEIAFYSDEYPSVILYTAKTKRPLDLIAVLAVLDGVTITLHEQYDVEPFNVFNLLSEKLGAGIGRSLRLNVFSGIDISTCNLEGWDVKEDIEWIKDCPLPENETIKRLNW